MDLPKTDWHNVNSSSRERRARCVSQSCFLFLCVYAHTCQFHSVVSILSSQSPNLSCTNPDLTSTDPVTCEKQTTKDHPLTSHVPDLSIQDSCFLLNTHPPFKLIKWKSTCRQAQAHTSHTRTPGRYLGDKFLLGDTVIDLIQ